MEREHERNREEEERLHKEVATRLKTQSHPSET